VLRGNRSNGAVGDVVVAEVEPADDGVTVDRVSVCITFRDEDEDAFTGVEVTLRIDGPDQVTVFIDLHRHHGLDSNAGRKVFISIVGSDGNDGHVGRMCEAICPGCDASQ